MFPTKARRRVDPGLRSIVESRRGLQRAFGNTSASADPISDNFKRRRITSTGWGESSFRLMV
jgi:hypothetical protein